MTEIRRSSGARIHQMRDAYRSSCSSTTDPYTGVVVNGSSCVASGVPHRNPLLQAIADHSNLGSAISGGSTASSSSTTTTTATGPTIGWAATGNGPTSQSASTCEIQFDEREIYYVSPSKRKGSFCQRNRLPPEGNCMRQTSSVTPQPKKRCDRIKSYSPPPFYPTAEPSTAYGSRAAGAAHDLSFDNFEISSHYSDTAMQVLRSGSCSGVGGVTGNSNLVTTAGSSSSSSLMAQHQKPGQGAPTPAVTRSTNNVTFSNCIGEERQSQQQQHRGSLRRSKGRSNQSLCSCDAGAETEIVPDPIRPLYQYSLERRSKGHHTYTCEQNAQILMRLERERNRKLSLNAAETGGKDTTEVLDIQSDTPSSADVDLIPPVPPPPSSSAIARKNSHRNLYRGQEELSNGGCDEIINDCANSVIEVGSLLDDCASTILKCANAVGSELLAAATLTTATSSNNSNKFSAVTGSAATTKPDVCRVTSRGDFHSIHKNNKNSYPLCIRDDIFISNSKKSDPSLCFLHAGPNGIGSTGAVVPFGSSSNQNNRNQGNRITLSLRKYNTIGPSSDYAKQLANYQYNYNQQLLLEQQQQHQQLKTQQFDNQSHLDRCRCPSQSLSNFSSGVVGGKEHYHHHHQRVVGAEHDSCYPMDDIYHTGGGVDGGGYSHWHPNEAAAISRSIGNLLDIDGSRVGGCGNGASHPYTRFQTPANVFSSSCSFGTAANLINSSFTTLASSSSGLKEKLHEQQHGGAKQLPQHDHHQHHHQHHHHQQQQQHQHQKHHQLHSSTTSIMPWKHRQCPSRGSSSSGTNSFRFDAAKHWLAVSSILLIIGAASVAVPLALRVAASAPFEERLLVAAQLLDQVPLIDGHNDLPWNIRKFLHNKLNDFNFDEDLRSVMPWARSHWSHTDLQRLKRGRISAQFWAAYVPCEAQHRDAVQLTLEQIDVIKRLTERYSPQLTTCTSAADIIEAHKNHQLCSLTGVEGGHSLGGSLAVLRTLYAIGVRYMTLTSTCHTPWADSSYADAPTFNVKHGGLTLFGKTIIREMNRLGMMVDLSHVSTGTMRDALEVTEAPVIFSHSSAYELCNSSRNVQDDMLQSLAKNGGLVMVNFYSKFLSCSENSTVHDAVAHINHIKRVAGIDHVGLGAGFDGINFTPKGLEDVSSYPTLFAELLGVGWSMEDLTKLAGGNFIRVMQEVEKIRDLKKSSGVKPFEDHPNFRTDDPYNCTSS